ncbi:hypothetical protein BJV77DRAFT_1024792 [Russula vinacea]|nr:hypothetical protein BJV77DRAFT_1024792 [Russula vinacea]
MWLSIMSACVFRPILPVDLYRDTHDVIRLVGDATPVPPRKFIVASTGYPVARSQHTHYTQRGRLSPHPSTLSQSTSNFQSDFPPTYRTHEHVANTTQDGKTWRFGVTNSCARLSGCCLTSAVTCRRNTLRSHQVAQRRAVIIPHAEVPIAFDTSRIEYSEENERALEGYMRARVRTICHADCAMYRSALVR